MSVCSRPFLPLSRLVCAKSNGGLVVRCSSMASEVPQRPVEKLVESSDEHAQFSVLSYNILSNQLALQHSNLYQDCRKEHVTWQYRAPRLIQEIVSYCPDVVCLQEVEKDHFDSTLVPGLEEHGFRGFHVARNGGHPDGCATFYRAQKFDLLSQTPVEYYRPNTRILDRNNVALLLLLRRKQEAADNQENSADTTDDGKSAPESDTVLVANTHLLFNTKRGDIKLAQIMVLMAEVRRLALIDSQGSSTQQYHPTVFAGDFNLVPFSPLYWFLISGDMRYEGFNQFSLSGQDRVHRQRLLQGATRNSYLHPNFGVSNRCTYEDVSCGLSDQGAPIITHSFGLDSAYQHFFRRDEPEFTTYHNAQCATVDYILYSSERFKPKAGLNALPYRQKLQLVGRRRLVRQKTLRPFGPMPNSSYPSDHLALQAFFQFTKAAALSDSPQSSSEHSPGSRKRLRS